MKKKESNFALLGAFNGLTAGLIASLCCLGPTLIVLVGLGSLFGISGLCFSDLRPHFMAAGIIIFILATLLYVYKGKNSCTLPTKKKTWFVIISLITMMITYIVLISYLVPYLQTPLANLNGVCSLHL